MLRPCIPVRALPALESSVPKYGDARAALERLAELGAAFGGAANYGGNGVPGRGATVEQYDVLGYRVGGTGHVGPHRRVAMMLGSEGTQGYLGSNVLDA
jgi:hypothetical protein